MTVAADTVHRERPFEDHVFAYLTEHAPEPDRWLAGDPSAYDKERALYPEDVVAWLRESQPAAWAKLEKLNGTNIEKRVLDALAKNLANSDTGGTLEVLRRGFPVAGAGGKLAMSQSVPEDDRNASVLERYRANRFRVVRQLKYNPTREWSIDLVFFVNGLPVSTWELKSDFTQSVEHAVRQYKEDRSPKAPQGGVEPLLAFRRGALVHFALSSTRAMMCTRLLGESSFFLPFDRGDDGRAGNAESDDPDRYPVAYLWEEIFRKDNLLTLIHRFFLFESKPDEDANGKRVRKETMFFPRYHQWQAVTKLDAAVREEGVGKRYLLEHSAGSGKTNTIAWLCHGLIRMQGPDDGRLFSSVIVVTDRTVLDDQLRDAIRQIDHQDGVVEGIEKGSGFDAQAKSARLAEALLARTPIVIVTIQTFPFAIEAILEHRSLADGKFAVVVDEAHASQTGQAASKLRAALSLEDDALQAMDPTEIMGRLQDARGFPDNVSYFAFTATPKHATLTLFGREDENGTPRSFHHYGMRQAIEEGFILDVLQGYISYKTARKLSETVQRDKRVDQKLAARALAQWASLHPTNVGQKVQFIVEHFRHNVAGLLNGQAKAMIVGSSRAQAVAYKLEFDRYIAEKGYGDLAALVAFSGKVAGDTLPGEHYPGLADEEFTEAGMNPGAKDLRESFDTDDYRVMIVANKFQTGFDQPKLCAMYLDKRVSGVEAVQTLSRLNRMAPGKTAESVYVVDFANEPEEILAAFRTWYDSAEVSGPQDYEVVYDLKEQLDRSGLYTQREVDEVARILTGELHATKQSARLVNAVDAPVKRFNEKLLNLNDSIARWDRMIADRDAAGDERGAAEAESRRAEQDAERDSLLKLRDGMSKFVRLYEFVAQVVPLGDAELEKLARFVRLFRKRLASVPVERIDLAGLQMTHWTLKEGDRIGEGPGEGDAEAPTLDPVKAAIAPGKDRARERLSEIIRALNDLFGEGVGEGDTLKRVTNMMAVSEMARRDDTVRKQLDAGNTDEQVMQGGDLTKAVEGAVFDLMADGNDAADAERLLKDRDSMRHYAWAVLRLMRSGLSSDELRNLS